VTSNSNNFSSAKGRLIYNYFLTLMTIIIITAGSKTSGKHSNTSTTVEADNLDEYCNSAALKVSNSRLGNLI
jgi:hypothetical protein